jgi:hypothetical protein
MANRIAEIPARVADSSTNVFKLTESGKTVPNSVVAMNLLMRRVVYPQTGI